MSGLLPAMLFFTAITGMWQAERRGDEMEIRLLEDGEDRAVQELTVPIASLIGIAGRQIDASRPAPVSFQIRGAAGTVGLDGSFMESKGSGLFFFERGASFLDDMRDLGYTGFDDAILLVYAMVGFTPEWVRELRWLGYEPSRKDLDDIAILRITPQFAREVESAWREKPTLRDLFAERGQIFPFALSYEK